VGNVAERGPSPPTFRKKFRNGNVFGCGLLYTKTRNHQKITFPKLPKNAKNNFIEYKYKQNGASVFAYSL